MADSTMFNVREDFDMVSYVNRFADFYRQKGYLVTVAGFENTAFVTVSKGIGGINTILGLGESVKVNFALNNGMMAVNLTESEWTSKIIGAVLGWFLCLIPLITALVGLSRQLSLHTAVINDATMLAAQSYNQNPGKMG